VCKGTKRPFRAPEGIKQNHRELTRNTLTPSAMLRPGALSCPDNDGDIPGNEKGPSPRQADPESKPPSTTKEVLRDFSRG
jgi:hypothetical protein